MDYDYIDYWNSLGDTTDFNFYGKLSDYTPEKLAQASAADLDKLLSELDVSGNKREFFAAFDTSEIDDIMKQLLLLKKCKAEQELCQEIQWLC